MPIRWCPWPARSPPSFLIVYVQMSAELQSHARCGCGAAGQIDRVTERYASMPRLNSRRPGGVLVRNSQEKRRRKQKREGKKKTLLLPAPKDDEGDEVRCGVSSPIPRRGRKPRPSFGASPDLGADGWILGGILPASFPTQPTAESTARERVGRPWEKFTCGRSTERLIGSVTGWANGEILGRGPNLTRGLV